MYRSTMAAALCVALVATVDITASRAGDFQTERERLFNPFSSGWDYDWDGEGPVSMPVSQVFNWDNPVDDDWKSLEIRRHSFSYNSLLGLGSGLTVDRVHDLATTKEDERRKTGHVWRTDPFLSFATGVTYEFELQIEPDSTPHAVMVSYTDQEDGFAFLFSPDAIDFAPFITYGTQYVTAHADIETTHRSLYRLVKPANSHAVSLYVDGDPNPLMSVLANSGRRASLVCHAGKDDNRCLDAPMLDIGDNSNDPRINGHFTVSRLRYRRGAALPGAPMPPLPKRLPPPLPPRGQAAWSGGGLTHAAPDFDALAPFRLPPVTDAARLYEPTGAYSDVRAVAANGGLEAFYRPEDDPNWHDGDADCDQILRIRGNGRGANGKWGSTLARNDAGDLVIDNLSGRTTMNISIYCPVGLSQPDGLTLELKLKITAESQERGFQLMYLDRKGQVSLLFSPDKVELGQGTKPTGFVAHRLNATRSNIYRLVRPNGSRLFYLYVNNAPRPAISDYHPGADFHAGAQIDFGDFGLQQLETLGDQPYVAPRGVAIIESIQWQGDGVAP